ncbi:MAG: hypothetical protein AAF555_07250 [Verrucomicrobiota bacterium]
MKRFPILIALPLLGLASCTYSDYGVSRHAGHGAPPLGHYGPAPVHPRIAPPVGYAEQHPVERRLRRERIVRKDPRPHPPAKEKKKKIARPSGPPQPVMDHRARHRPRSDAEFLSRRHPYLDLDRY